ncbi:MAG TPA: hypothetical protein VMV09_04815 [Candidatus Saccharimonadales bacterium]|nr:hypothetical protein [Candidatus Saccharimonadales bacterium]
MSDAGEFVDQLLEWDGTDEAPYEWARAHESEILNEATTGAAGPITEAFERIDQLAGSNDDAAVWGLGALFASVRDAAGAAFHKLWGFVSTGARRVTPLWNALSALFHRYAGKIKDIARKLGADGYSISLNIPFGFSLGLNFSI